jgi:hypothetical protein
MKHYIALGGFSGYLPSSCEVYTKREDALENLEYGFELSEDQLDEVIKTGIVYLNPIHGADYCEVQECDCATPWTHSEDMEEVQWYELYGKEE